MYNTNDIINKALFTIYIFIQGINKFKEWRDFDTIREKRKREW